MEKSISHSFTKSRLQAYASFAAKGLKKKRKRVLGTEHVQSSKEGKKPRNFVSSLKTKRQKVRRIVDVQLIKRRNLNERQLTDWIGR